MTPLVASYGIYLVISLGLTVWVARTLFRHGARFLIDVFGDETLADSVNHLLVVGFYLINLGYVALALKVDTPPQDVGQVIEALSGKVGLVLLVLGAMHFANLAMFRHMRQPRPARSGAGSLPSASPPVVHPADWPTGSPTA